MANEPCNADESGRIDVWPPIDPLVDPAWYAVHTRSRHEKMVDRQLLSKGYRTLLPLMKTWSIRTDRKVRVERPMFAGYLFIWTSLDPELHLGILRTVGVVKLVSLQGKPVPVNPTEIESIRVLMESGQSVLPTDFLSKGSLVRIIGGPFKGVVGILEDKLSSRRLVVSVEILCRSVCVEVPENIVLKAEAL